MAKVFVSFLGTNPYLHCKYKIEGIQSKPVRYVQEALAEHYGKKWSKEDRFLVFATGDTFDSSKKIRSGGGSITKNWYNAQVNERDAYLEVEARPLKGLEGRLADLKLPCEIKMIEIPDGTLDGEIWIIIRRISEAINSGDEVHFDVTHSFRYIPMIVPAIISFLKRTKKIQLGNIHYGAFETLGNNQEVCEMPIDARIAPVRNLREIYEMIEWSEAVQAFKDNGDERLLVGQMKNAQKPDSSKKAVRKLSETLSLSITNINKMGNSIRMTNVKELENVTDTGDISTISIDDAPELFPLAELGKEIQNSLSVWTSDEIKNGFSAAKWCIDNQRTAQALTFAHEAATGFFCKVVGWDGNEHSHRSSIDFLLSIKRKDLDPTTKQPLSSNDFRSKKEDKEWFVKSCEAALVRLDSFDSEIADFKTLSGWRNTVSHAKKGNRSTIEKLFPAILSKFENSYSNHLQVAILERGIE